MIAELSWQSLEEGRRIHRLTLLYQIQRGLIDINAGSILRSNDKRTRGAHRIYQPSATQPVYKYSFHPRTIQDWNRLPATTNNQTLEEFVAAIQTPLAAVIRTINSHPLLLLTVHRRSFDWKETAVHPPY